MEVFKHRRVGPDWLCAHLGEAKGGVRFPENDVVVCTNCTHQLIKINLLKEISDKLSLLLKKIEPPPLRPDDYELIGCLPLS